MSNNLKIGVYGAGGRMGQMIITCLKEYPNVNLSIAYDISSIDSNANVKFTNSLEELFNDCDVIIDFTSKDGTNELLKYALSSPKPICIGSTGLDEETFKLLKECSNKMPILYATNMSLGVALANKLVAMASKILRDFDIELVEMHHRNKIDAPSGTAITLASSAANARGLNLKDVMVTGREGMVGKRTKDEIAVLAQRGGDIVGKHDVGFYGDGEFLQIIHTATSRATFANGAIKAAIWVCAKKPGLYNINDCLEI